MMMIIDAGQVQRINGKARAKYSAKMHDETQDWMMLMFILAAVHFTAELGSSDGPGNEKHPAIRGTGNTENHFDNVARTPTRGKSLADGAGPVVGDLSRRAGIAVIAGAKHLLGREVVAHAPAPPPSKADARASETTDAADAAAESSASDAADA